MDSVKKSETPKPDFDLDNHLQYLQNQRVNGFPDGVPDVNWDEIRQAIEARMDAIRDGIYLKISGISGILRNYTVTKLPEPKLGEKDNTANNFNIAGRTLNRADDFIFELRISLLESVRHLQLSFELALEKRES